MLKLWNLPHSGILFRGQFQTTINHQRLYIPMFEPEGKVPKDYKSCSICKSTYSLKELFKILYYTPFWHSYGRCIQPCLHYSCGTRCQWKYTPSLSKVESYSLLLAAQSQSEKSNAGSFPDRLSVLTRVFTRISNIFLNAERLKVLYFMLCF